MDEVKGVLMVNPGGIGQPLSLLLKLNPDITEVCYSLYFFFGGR